MTVTFALVCLPLVYVIGCGVDCSRVARLRSQLRASANAASAGSVAKVSPGLRAARVMMSDGPVAVGVADAVDIFNARMAGVSGYTLDSVTATVTKRGAMLTAELSFSAHVQTGFLRMIGRPAVTVHGASTATAKLPRFIDVFVPPRQFAGADPDAGSPAPQLQ
ncbi:MAG TPA: pilus assembly protein TadG-related protein [Bradyrhizobium sp.]